MINEDGNIVEQYGFPYLSYGRDVIDNELSLVLGVLLIANSA